MTEFKKPETDVEAMNMLEKALDYADEQPAHFRIKVNTFMSSYPWVSIE